MCVVAAAAVSLSVDDAAVAAWSVSVGDASVAAVSVSVAEVAAVSLSAVLAVGLNVARFLEPNSEFVTGCHNVAWIFVPK